MPTRMLYIKLFREEGGFLKIKLYVLHGKRKLKPYAGFGNNIRRVILPRQNTKAAVSETL